MTLHCTWALHRDPVRTLCRDAAQESGTPTGRWHHDRHQLLMTHEPCVAATHAVRHPLLANCTKHHQLGIR